MQNIESMAGKRRCAWVKALPFMGNNLGDVPALVGFLWANTLIWQSLLSEPDLLPDLRRLFEMFEGQRIGLLDRLQGHDGFDIRNAGQA